MRILLYVATNLAVLVVLGIVTSLLGINPRSQSGLLVFALLFGFTGSIISLLASKPMAIRTMKVHLIRQPVNEEQAWLVETVRKFATEAKLGMPDVGIYEGAPNAFATGARKNSALVAVSTGLLQGMTREEITAVIGHEMAHVANGDMVTMTLLQGVMNTFVIYISRIIGSIVDAKLNRNNNNQSGPSVGYYITVTVMDILLGVLASIIVAWFSRYREFRADAGSAKLMGQSLSMQKALRRLETLSNQPMPKNMANFAIAGDIGKLFSSHPPLPERIAALQKL